MLAIPWDFDLTNLLKLCKIAVSYATEIAVYDVHAAEVNNK